LHNKKFKVGQRVIVEVSPGIQPQYGYICCCDKCLFYGIRLDQKGGGHRCCGNCNSGFGWCASKNSIKIIHNCKKKYVPDM